MSTFVEKVKALQEEALAKIAAGKIKTQAEFEKLKTDVEVGTAKLREELKASEEHIKAVGTGWYEDAKAKFHTVTKKED